jgi:hypothetical protein
MHMENNNDGHTHGEGENLCMMCRMNERMHGRGCGHCHGMYHFALLRIVILLALLGFVFWAGVCVGGFENGGAYGRHHGMMEGRGMMISGYDGYDGYPDENVGYRVFNASASTDASPQGSVTVHATAVPVVPTK